MAPRLPDVATLRVRGCDASGFGNRRGVAVLRVKGCDVNGRPLDPSHRWNG